MVTSACFSLPESKSFALSGDKIFQVVAFSVPRSSLYAALSRATRTLSTTDHRVSLFSLKYWTALSCSPHILPSFYFASSANARARCVSVSPLTFSLFSSFSFFPCQSYVEYFCISIFLPRINFSSLLSIPRHTRKERERERGTRWEKPIYIWHTGLRRPWENYRHRHPLHYENPLHPSLSFYILFLGQFAERQIWMKYCCR